MHPAATVVLTNVPLPPPPHPTSPLPGPQSHHQAEIYRLKGLFLAQLQDDDSSFSSFSTALCLWRQCPEAWVSWGQHCDDCYERTRNVQYLEYAVHCYLQVRCLEATLLACLSLCLWM